MTCTLPPQKRQQLAQDYYDASVTKIGTDEALVVDTLCHVKNEQCVREFNHSVDALMTPDDLAGLPVHTRNEMVISRIFKDELSGVRYTEAKDCLTLGRKTYSNSGLDYYFDGIGDSGLLDWSDTGSKIAVGGMIVAGVVIGIAAGPVVLAVVGLAAGAAGVVGYGAAHIKNAIEYAVTEGPSAKEELHDMGEATTGLVASAAAVASSAWILSGEINVFAGRGPGIGGTGFSNSVQMRSAPPISSDIAEANGSGLFRVKISMGDNDRHFVWDRELAHTVEIVGDGYCDAPWSMEVGIARWWNAISNKKTPDFPKGMTGVLYTGVLYREVDPYIAHRYRNPLPTIETRPPSSATGD